jgi:hypothetical protein
MKLNSNKAPVEISGGGSQSSFSIAMNGKAFRVLSDQMYQNKIGSIVREISCNAVDAHIMAGTPELPFRIHLPDAFEPWFSVQDFGIGLTPDAIESVFTVYFASTKDTSNDTVGAFGLGAKTPFSYTDQFTVTSVVDGVKRMYSAFIMESGIPSIKEMDCSKTTECNGVEIKMSAKREDYNKFASEVSEQLKFFKVKPVVVNTASQFKFQPVSLDVVIDTKNVAITNTAAGYGQAWASLIQGQVGYPLDINQLREKISAENKRLLDALSGSQVRFYFNIGEIGVTASREGVEYNKSTIANINKKLDAVRVELTAYIEGKIKAFATSYEKATFLNSSQAILKLARASGISIPNVKANNSGYYFFDFSDLMLDPKNKNSYGQSIALGTVKAWVHGKSIRETTQAVITPQGNSGETYIVFRDTNSKPNIRAKHYLSTLGNKCNRLLEIDMLDNDTIDDKFIANLVTALGGYDKIKRLSEIDPPAKVTVAADGTKVRGAYSRPTYYSYNSEAGTNVRAWGKEFDDLDEIEDDYVYVVIDDMAMAYDDQTLITGKYASLARVNGNKCLPLIGVRVNDVKKLNGVKNVVPLADYINTSIVKMRDDMKLRIKWKHAVIGNAINNCVHQSLKDAKVQKELNAVANKISITKMLSLATRMGGRLHEHDNRLYYIGELMGWDSVKFASKYDTRIKKCYDSMMVRYPLLKAYSDWSVRSHITPEHLAKYVSVM